MHGLEQLKIFYKIADFVSWEIKALPCENAASLQFIGI